MLDENLSNITGRITGINGQTVTTDIEIPDKLVLELGRRSDSTGPSQNPSRRVKFGSRYELFMDQRTD